MMTTRSVTVATTADIKPGELAAFDVAGVPVAVANVDGRFFAIGDTRSPRKGRWRGPS